MSRVSENSTSISVARALNRAKSRIEDLHTKGASLRRVNRPSDDPVGSIDILSMNSRMADNKQYIKNADFVSFNLRITESALAELGDILLRAKELAVGLASDLHGENIRKNIAQEIRQLRNQALAVANKKVGHRYIFGGYKTQERPFNEDGTYNGDFGHITLEVGKDVFVQTNLHGGEIFYTSAEEDGNPLPVPIPAGEEEELPSMMDKGPSRGLASVAQAPPVASGPIGGHRNGVLAQLERLGLALERNDTGSIQNLLPHLDQSVSQIVRLRTQVGAIDAFVQNAKGAREGENSLFTERRGRIRDADVAELFSEIAKQKSVLKASQHASGRIVNNSLMNFIR